VGLLSWLGLSSDQLALAASFESPLTSESMAATDPVVAAAFGLSTGSTSVTRTEAMTVPAVRRGRAVIAGTLGTMPLVAYRGDQLERVPRSLLEQPNPNTTRQHVLTWTVDDLIFHGISWWRVTDRDPEGYPRQVERLARDRVTLDVNTGRVWVDGQPADDRDLIRFDGPDEGVLVYGGRTLRTCLMLEDAVRRNADGLPPLDLLTLEEGAAELLPEEITALLDEWQQARRDRSTAFMNRAIKHQSVGYDAEAAGLADARLFQAGEVARLLNLPPRYVNAPSATGMTYTNVQAERLELVDLSLAPYLTAVEQRLSMADVTPRGQRVLVDLTAFLRGDQKTALEAAKTAVEIGATTADEVRADVYNRPPLTGSSDA
jgi:phage portal protein BeeE